MLFLFSGGDDASDTVVCASLKFACLCVCVYIHLRRCEYHDVYMYVCMYVLYGGMYECMDACMYVRTYVCNMCMLCMYACLYVEMCVYACMYVRFKKKLSLLCVYAFTLSMQIE